MHLQHVAYYKMHVSCQAQLLPQSYMAHAVASLQQHQRAAKLNHMQIWRTVQP